MTKTSLSTLLFQMLPLPDSTTQWLSTPEIARKAMSEDKAYNKRKVERQLESLANDKLAICERRGNTNFWQRPKLVPALLNNGTHRMSEPEALAVQTLQRFAGRTLPGNVGDILQSLFSTAQTVLTAPEQLTGLYNRWSRKIEVVDGGFSPVRNEIPKSTFDAVSRALFYENPLKLRYLSSSARTKGLLPEEKIVWPLALVDSGGMPYLVVEDTKFPRTTSKPKPLRYVCRLDRVSDAIVQQDDYFQYPADFSLSELVDSDNGKQFDFVIERVIRLELAADPRATRQLVESRMSWDQTSEPMPDGRTKFTGTVTLGLKLRWWIRQFGPTIEVLSPSDLREDAKREAEQLAMLYAVIPLTPQI